MGRHRAASQHRDIVAAVIGHDQVGINTPFGSAAMTQDAQSVPSDSPQEQVQYPHCSPEDSRGLPRSRVLAAAGEG